MYYRSRPPYHEQFTLCKRDERTAEWYPASEKKIQKMGSSVFCNFTTKTAIPQPLAKRGDYGNLLPLRERPLFNSGRHPADDDEARRRILHVAASHFHIGKCPAEFMVRELPMDVIKLRAQLQRKPKANSVLYRVARRILSEEGVTAFWHGHTLGQMHSVLAVSSQFYTYELTTRYSSGFNIPKQYRPIQNFLCGTVAGCTCTMLVIPLEVIRVRQMLVKDQYKNIFQGAKAVYRYGGPLAFYEGLSASLLQMGPQVGISFAVFSFFQPMILKCFAKCPPSDCNKGVGNKHRPQNLIIASSLAGSAAGFISKTMTYPFDLAKRRLQIGSHRSNFKYKVPSQARRLLKCTKLSECLIIAYKREGLKGLFRGWTVTVYKAQLTSVVAFTSYELMCYATREFDAR